VFDTARKKLIATRIKELRKSKNLSHQRLAEELTNKYSIKISKDSLLQYEIDKEYHAKWDKVKGMNIEYLYCIADFFEVSADYILGFTNNPTTDKDLDAVSKYIGLGQEAVEKLNRYAKMDIDYPNYTNALSHLNMFIKEDSFYIFDYLDKYIQSICFCKFLEQEYPKADLSARSLGIVINSKTGEIKHRDISEDEEEARKDYLEEVEEKQPLYLYTLQKMFIDFVEQYGKFKKENTTAEEFFKQFSTAESSRKAFFESIDNSLDRLKNSMDKFSKVVKDDVSI